MIHVIHEHEYVCPHCGLVCATLTDFHKHVKRVHEKEGPKNEKAK